MRWLKIEEPGFIGLCSYCGVTIYSNEEYVVVVRNGWGRPRLALACKEHGSKAKNLKRTIKYRPAKPARVRQPVLTPGELSECDR